MDPNKRAAYDRYGEAGLRSGAGGGGYHHVDLSEALGKEGGRVGRRTRAGAQEAYGTSSLQLFE